jgi:two-component system, OmpR family, response regulator TctD
MARLLIVYRRKQLLHWAAATLRSAGYEVMQAPNGRDARLLLRTDSFDALVIEISRSERARFAFLRSLREERRQVKVIAIATARPAIPSTVALTISRALGADAILYWPHSSDELLDAVANVLAV